MTAAHPHDGTSRGNGTSRGRRSGALARFGGWTAGHPWLTLLAAVSVMVGVLGASISIGTKYSNIDGIPGTESQQATDVLKRSFPAQAGDSDQIVFHVSVGSVNSPAIRSRITPMLAAVAGMPHVTSVVSPYS